MRIAHLGFVKLLEMFNVGFDDFAVVPATHRVRRFWRSATTIKLTPATKRAAKMAK